MSRRRLRRVAMAKRIPPSGLPRTKGPGPVLTIQRTTMRRPTRIPWVATVLGIVCLAGAVIVLVLARSGPTASASQMGPEGIPLQEGVPLTSAITAATGKPWMVSGAT